MSNKSLLKVENLDVFYGDLQAIHNVSMQIEEGKIVSIIGSNGSGKSTLLKTIIGENTPKTGTVMYAGKDITGLKTNQIVAKGISMSPEGSKVFESMSVEENLLIGAYLPHARKQRKELLENVYNLFPILREKRSQLATYLSGGQRQMLAISRALMSDPKILICDEISLGLAPVIIKDIYKKLIDINDKLGMTIVLVEQEVKRSLKYSDYSYVLVKGQLVMEGKSSELKESEVNDAYFGINEYA